MYLAHLGRGGGVKGGAAPLNQFWGSLFFARTFDLGRRFASASFW